ncbi:Os01g0336300, partial [Oryza sativa Japonica Group]
ALVEVWDIVAGVCSNWSKMALLGHYIRHEPQWRRCRRAHAALDAMLRFRPARRWRNKIGQNSVLEPRRFCRRSGLLSEKLYGRAGLMRSVEVSPAVKDTVLRSLMSSYGRSSRGSRGGAASRRQGRLAVVWLPKELGVRRRRRLRQHHRHHPRVARRHEALRDEMLAARFSDAVAIITGHGRRVPPLLLLRVPGVGRAGAAAGQRRVDREAVQGVDGRRHRGSRKGRRRR